mmetsp:Transcript_9393/g.11694  ORF Transcript_9393/g.11694 Transcript_9393/m.11694 type:complete len:96 (+) Transcript_9393:602-889(+)
MSLGMIPGSFIGPIMAGRIYDKNGNYDNAIIGGSVFLFISAASMFLLPSPAAGDDLQAAKAQMTQVKHESEDEKDKDRHNTGSCVHSESTDVEAL